MAIRLCEHKNLGGRCQDFDVGSYTKSSIHGSGKVGNDEISSIKILKPGFYIRAFEHDNYGGTEKDFNNDVGNLKDVGFNDKITSFIVVDGNPPPLEPLPPVIAAPAQSPSAPVPIDYTPPTYVPPVAAPADTGSSAWIWILLIVLFVVLAAIGAGVYWLKKKASAPTPASV